MAFRQYTKCYEYTSGDKPFHESDLVGTILAVGGVVLLGAILSFAFGFFIVGGVFFAVGYAGTIAEVARQWLYHRLICIGDQPKCAVGVVVSTPEIGGFGEFDNDQFFDLRLLPHRPNDDYKSANTAYQIGAPGPSIDSRTELRKENDVYLDGFQGEEFMKQIAFHSDPGNVEDANVGDKDLGPISEGDRVVVYGRHVYDGFHEGWHEIHPLMTIVKLHPDREAGSYMEWNPDFNDPAQLPSDLPGMPSTITGLTIQDMVLGLASDKFRERAVWLRKKWCGLIHEAYDEATAKLQATEEHRWTIHPDVDGCEPDSIEPPK